MSAEFKVIKVDPQGSGMDWAGHLGSTVYHAQRCCNNCSMIFGRFEGWPYDPEKPDSADNDPAPIGFIPSELQPINQEAWDIVQEIMKDHPVESKYWTPSKPSVWSRIKSFVLGFWQ